MTSPPEVTILPVSAVVPTRNREAVFESTLASLAAQSCQPAEIIVVDASDGVLTEALCRRPPAALASTLHYAPATRRGAARQRNQGVKLAKHDTIFFFDDDIRFDPDCVVRLWSALEEDPLLGGVNSMVSNQSYQPPGRASRCLFRLMSDSRLDSYAGRCLGPGLNLLPEDRDDLPPVVPVEWLNTTATLYRRKYLPDPPFPDSFTGYSLCEDLALSLLVARRAKLANARTARIFHLSCGGDHKSSHAELMAMSIANRYFVMRRILDRASFVDHCKFVTWQLFDMVAQVRAAPALLPQLLFGAARGLASAARV